MRFAKVPLEVAYDKRLNKNDLKVLIALLAHADGNGECHPRRKVLAEITGLPITRISSITSNLVDLGWLSKVGNGGFSKASEYRITVPKTVTLNTVTNSVTVTGENSNRNSNPGVTDSVTKTVTETGTGKEQTIEQTNRTVTQPQRTSAERFEVFYKAYPKHKSRGQAEKAWKQIKPDEQLLQTMLDAIERAKTSEDWRKDGGQYIPYPASWLRAKGWEDEITTSTQEQSWYETASGITRQGNEWGITQDHNEPFPIFRERVFTKAHELGIVTCS